MSIKFTTTSLKPKPELLERLRQLLGSDNVRPHNAVSHYTATQFGGVAELVVIVSTTKELVETLTLLLAEKQPYTIIGSGTGLLFSQVGFAGVVIINRTANLSFAADASQVVVDGGYSSSALVNVLASRSWGGVEFLAAIPGTIGGAVATGAHWQGKALRSYVREIVIAVPEGEEVKILTLTGRELPANHTTALFPLESVSNPIILSVKLQVAALTQPEILRRLRIVRNQRQLTSFMLGQVFEPPLSTIALNWRRLPKDLLYPGVSLSRPDPDILEFQPSKIQAANLRSSIERLEDYCRENGYTVSQRLAYLGYWPREGEDEQGSPDTESISK